MLTEHRLRELLSYDAASGALRWRRSRGRANAGDAAGVVNAHGYVVVRVDGMLYPAHRLAWLWTTGQTPPRYIDHANGDRADNRWTNLREATQTQNNANQKRRSDNKTGFKGAMRTSRGRFRAEIRVHGRSRYLGTFDTPEAAHAAYVAAAIATFGDFARAA